MATDLRVLVRNSTGAVVDELTELRSLSARRVRNGTGSWVLELSAQSRYVSIFEAGGGIVLKLDGVTKFSGTASVSIDKTSELVTITGVDDNVLLEEPARPTPTLADPDPVTHRWPDAEDVRTGVTSTIISQYVGANIGALAPLTDAAGNPVRIPNLYILGDPGLGAVQTGRANLQSLRALLAGLAVTPAGGGLNFEILQSDVTSGRLDFRIWAPRDHRQIAKFSIEIDSASEYRDTRTLSDVNYWYVMGGDGLGADRTVVSGGDAALIAAAGRRIVGVHDARGITDLGELQQKLAELIAGAITTRKTAIVPLETPGNEYGAFWDLGDVVTVTIGGEERAEVIQEIVFEIDADRGLTIMPTVGDAGSDTGDETAQHLKTVTERLSNLERNYNVPPDSVDSSMLVPVLKPAVGQVVAYAGTAAPSGWLLCQGQSLLRSAYPVLFAVIGTTYGSVDGTHFTLPDLRGRVILGVSGSHALATTGGSETAAGLAHTHPGSHSHGLGSHVHTGAAHTHPGSHSHGAGTLAIAHDHDVDINHDHAAFSSGGENTFAATFSTYPGTTTNVSHNHTVDVPALGTNTKTTTGAAHTSRSGSTDVDSNAPAASAGNTGAAAGSTDADTNAPAASYSGSIATLPPYISLQYLIYAAA